MQRKFTNSVVLLGRDPLGTHTSARTKTDPIWSPLGCEPPICSLSSGLESAAPVEPGGGGGRAREARVPSLLGHGSTCGLRQTCLFVFEVSRL